MVRVGVVGAGHEDLVVAEGRSVGIAPVEGGYPPVAGLDDVAVAAIVGGQFPDIGIGEVLPECAEPLGVGAAETVDELVLVADHADVPVDRRQAEQELLLSVVGVLVLVHQEVMHRPAQVGGQSGILEENESLGLKAGEVDGALFQQQQPVPGVAMARAVVKGEWELMRS